MFMMQARRSRGGGGGGGLLSLEEYMEYMVQPLHFHFYSAGPVMIWRLLWSTLRRIVLLIFSASAFLSISIERARFWRAVETNKYGCCKPELSL